MPSFPTNGPIRLVVDISVGDVAIVAGDRRDVVVDVRPRSAARAGDVRAAETTAIEFRVDQLTVRGPKAHAWGLFGFGKGDTISVTVAVPTGSHIDVETLAGTIRVDGRIGDGRFRTGDGAVRLGDAANLEVETGRGEVVARDVAGRLDLVTGGGVVRIGSVAGPATVKNSHGNVEIGSVGADLRINAAHGHIVVGRVDGSLAANTAYGTIRVDAVARGSVQLDTAYGGIEIGVRSGTAAWLDAHTAYGRVRNTLAGGDGRAPNGATAEIFARTAYGDITVRRAPGAS